MIFVGLHLLALVAAFFLELTFIYFCFQVITNVYRFRGNTYINVPFAIPSVSVLVPARNEEKNIGECLQSILQQDFPIREIVVINDGSTDKTGEIVEQLQKEHSFIRLVQNTACPPGWYGKHHALYRGVQQAQGDYLLFVDADVRLFPKCITQTLSYALVHGADLVTVLPRILCLSFWEKVILPVWGYMIVVSMKTSLTRGRAFGPYYLFRKAVYLDIGGHERIKDIYPEDIALGQLAKSAGYQVHMVLGPDSLAARMYIGFRHIWQGISRSTDYQKVGRLLVGLVVTFSLFVLPWLSVPMAFGYGWIYGWSSLVLTVLGLATGTCLLALITHRLVAQSFPVNWPYAFLQPLGGLMVMAMFVSSIFRGIHGDVSRHATYIRARK